MLVVHFLFFSTNQTMKKELISALPAFAELISEFGPTLKDMLSESSVSISQPHPGSWWITHVDGTLGLWNGQVVSLYYHPSSKHTATTVGKLGEKKSVTNGGHWAISHQTKALVGNKAYYNTL